MTSRPDRLNVWWRPLPNDQPELIAQFFSSLDPVGRTLLSGIGYVGAVMIVFYTLANIWFHVHQPWLGLVIVLDVSIGLAFFLLAFFVRREPFLPTHYVFFPLFFLVFLLTGIISYLIDDLIGYLALVILTNSVLPIVPWPPRLTRFAIASTSLAYIGFNVVWQSPYAYLNQVQPFLILTVLGSAAVAVIFHSTLLHQRWEGFLAARSVAVLNEQLQKHTAVLETLNHQLTQQNAELDAFAHTAAHDLKTPLNVIYGYAGLLQDELNEATFAPESAIDLPELLDVTNRITQNSRAATNIVNELLLLASVRREAVQIAPVDMTEVVTVALGRHQAELTQVGAEVVLPPSWPTAVGYAPWLVEVWANYLSNALKYGGRPCEIRLGAETLAQNEVQFWVQDNGAGLSAEQTSQLFREFTRLHTQVEGHGLGLTIVARIINKLDGRVGVESELGRGSRFYFVLPSSPH